MGEGLTPEEHKLAREIEARMNGEDTRRMTLSQVSRELREIQKYSEDRIRQALDILIDLEFLEAPDWSMFAHVPWDDRKKHLSLLVLKGLKEYDDYYRRQR